MNYPLFLPFGLVSLFTCICTLAGGFAVGYHVLRFGFAQLPLTPSRREPRHPARLFFAVFCCTVLIDLLYLYFVSYPGILTQDSHTTMAQIHSGVYNNTMPFYHTVTVELFYKIGMALFHEPNRALALFHVVQILFLGAVFAYTLVTLYQAGAPWWFLMAAFGVYVLQPYNIVYSSTLWKDIPFGAAALLLAVSLYRILRGMGKAPWSNYLCFLAGAFGLCLWRTNGWYAFAATTLVMLLFFRKGHKGLLLTLCAVTAVCWFLIGPLLSWLNISETDLVEALAVPFQQLGRVIVQERPLNAEDQERLSLLFDLEQVKALYDPKTVDPMKFEALRRHKLPLVTQELGSYIGMYLRLGLQYPLDYLAAWIEQTKGYWNGGYDYWIYTQETFHYADFGLFTDSIGGRLAGVFNAWFRLLETPAFLRVLSSIGLQTWLLVYCFLMNLWKKREEALLVIPLLVLAAGLCIGSPVYAAFRYAYPLFLTVPLLLGVTLFQKPAARL